MVEEREENERRDGPRRNRPTVPCYYLRSCGESAFQDPFLPSFLPDALLPSLLRISSRPPFVAAAAACCLLLLLLLFSPRFHRQRTTLPLCISVSSPDSADSPLLSSSSSSSSSFSHSLLSSSLLPPFAQLFKFRNWNLNICSLKIEFSSPGEDFSTPQFPLFRGIPFARFFFIPPPPLISSLISSLPFFLYFFALITSKLSDPTSHGVPVYSFFQD